MARLTRSSGAVTRRRRARVVRPVHWRVEYERQGQDEIGSSREKDKGGGARQSRIKAEARKNDDGLEVGFS
jgi:hypothetical protein